MAISFLVAVIFAAPAEAATPSPPRPLSLSGCPQLIVYGARGSGEPLDDSALGLGGPGSVLYQVLSHSPLTHAALANGYRAVPLVHQVKIFSGLPKVPDPAPSRDQLLADYTGAYLDSVNNGIASTTADLNMLANTCPTSQIVATGYSQGAEALRFGIAALPASVYTHIKSVVLFGDPWFLPTEANATMFGGFSPNPATRGIRWHVLGGLPKALPIYFKGRMLSFCHNGDIICQSGGDLLLRPHLTYGNDAPVAAALASKMLTLPSAPPGSTVPGGTVTLCEAFVADRNYPDGSVVAPGLAFTKTWGLKNCGAAWSGVSAVRVAGSYGPASFSVPNFAAGGSGNVSAVFTAPTAPGLYRATYRLRRNGDGALANNAFWVQVNVAGPGTNCEAFVADLTLPDGAQLAPGQTTTKSWRLRNCGTTNWSGLTAVRTAGGFGPASFPVPVLAPGSAATLSVPITSPSAPGHYRATYRLRAANGGYAANSFWVDIIVPSIATDCEAFVADVTLPDGAAVAGGQALSKTWRLRNCGTTNWSGLTAVRVAGAYGPISFPIPTVTPGGTADLTVPMTAPSAAGTARATYRLQAADGHFADNSFWVQLNVSGTAIDCEAFVTDLTVPDGSTFAPNQAFSKSWRLRNCGTTDWSTLTAVRTDGVFGPASFPVPVTPPGGIADLTVPVTAPSAPGHYRATYRLQAADGHYAMYSFWVDINVSQQAYHYTIVNTGGIGVNVRTGPATTYGVTRTIPAGGQVNIVCQTHGQRVFAETDIWDLTTSGDWVYDEYVSTPNIGAISPPLGLC